VWALISSLLRPLSTAVGVLSEVCCGLIVFCCCRDCVCDSGSFLRTVRLVRPPSICCCVRCSPSPICCVGCMRCGLPLSAAVWGIWGAASCYLLLCKVQPPLVCCVYSSVLSADWCGPFLVVSAALLPSVGGIIAVALIFCCGQLLVHPFLFQLLETALSPLL